MGREERVLEGLSRVSILSCAGKKTKDISAYKPLMISNPLGIES